MAAPLPPPIRAPSTAPIAAPPPTYLAVRLLAPRPLPEDEDPDPGEMTEYRRPSTVTERRARTVSLPSGLAVVTSCARELRGIATLPLLSTTSLLTVAEYAVPM